MKKSAARLITTCIAFATIAIANAQPYYVATNGNDRNAGTIDQPFASLTKARDALRQARKNSRLKDGTTVFVRGGNYTLSGSLELTQEDGGEAGKPIVYKAYQGEEPHFIGGAIVDRSNWKSLDKSGRKRVHPSIDPGKLLQLNVGALSFTNINPFAPKNQFTIDWFIIDLFANGKRQPLSQWPNPAQNIRGKNDAGWTTCNGSKDNCSFYFGKNGKPDDKDSSNELDLDGTRRSERWADAIIKGHEVWLKGNWRVPWEPVTMKVKDIDTKDQSITFFEQPPGGMGSKYSAVMSGQPVWRKGTGKETWFALNLLEEIDQPGEWALDVTDKMLYYYPAAPITAVEIMIADTRQPLFSCKNTSNLRIENLFIEGGLGTAIEINNSSNVVIAGCNILNAGSCAISMNGGSNNTIQSNNIAESAGSGIKLENLGNRFTLTGSNVEVNNNHIHHIGQLSYKDAISISNSVGVKITHNLLHDLPKAGIRADMVNNCLFEYNEIHNIALKEGDNGVFYNYGGWSTYGNVYRYNFAHHINRSNAFYSDDGDSGDFYYKNIVYDCNNGVLFGGGHDVLAENNLFIKSKSQTIDDRGKDRNYRLGTKYETDLSQFLTDKSPWKEYGELLMKEHQLTTKLWNDVYNAEWHPELPNGSRMKNNVAVASGSFVVKTGNASSVDNTSINTIEQAAFTDFANMDLRTINKAILDKFPELNDVFNTIGLQKDAYRSTIPTRKQTNGLSNRLSNENTDTEDKMIDKVRPAQ